MTAGMVMGLWGLFLALSLGVGAAGGRRLLPTAVALGGAGLAGEGVLLAAGQLLPSRVALPAPFPALHWGPGLVGAGVWGAVGGGLFLAAGLWLLQTEGGVAVAWALIPLEAAVGAYLLSDDGWSLLASWELVSTLAYLGLVTSRTQAKVLRVGWVLLALSEFGGVLLLGALLLLMPAPAHGHLEAGFTTLARVGAGLSPGLRLTLALAVLLAFGVKAGLFPVMVWMPMAEPEAPGVVAGLFSGLLSPLALVGLVSTWRLLGPLGGAWGQAWGWTLVVLGVAGALSAALYGMLERDVKRVLAYSTLEVLGVAFAGLGTGLLTAQAGNPVAAALAADGAWVLLLTHAGAKFVLFVLGDEVAGRLGRRLDRLGGVTRVAPGRGALALLGVLALAAVPPTGGFVGEWMVFEGILMPLHADPVRHLLLMAAGAGLALATALGVTLYLRWYGWTFLGPRWAWRTEAPPAFPPLGGLRGTGLGLAALPVLIAGPGIPWLLPVVEHGFTWWRSAAPVLIAPTLVRPASAAPLVAIGANLVPAPGAAGTVFFPAAFSVGDPYVLFWVAVALFAVVVGMRRVTGRHRVRRVPAWTGGALPAGPPFVFSAEGMVHPLRLAFAAFFGLRRWREERDEARYYRHTVVYRLEAHVYAPLVRAARALARVLRSVQSGDVNWYLGLLLVAVTGALLAFNLGWLP
ncbi:Hydrogenase-4 component B / Formate hydrogenlyase subunit 3 [Candidatus Hydrogenisulfobacillus filiaventi]|uniref:Hydrogenase-4 component B / Formate hydrogenlyase subunit 3 n=1 Tax=Candidatus Hydrogenisulfobacillus filiaventi TaxID=2707344 RepID=A0A6F8ZCE8_9FIRM|nr:proton-conducting transporter membrane subunit [Bacillota bacterium]CAB1127538.1 Hydrogenase-4 component B / Formate hydrogenlyase subunit 3 [Candidatus Hydrogenisulfobacillus filiaventi]